MGARRTSSRAVVAAADELWSPEDVAAYFKVSDRTIRDWRAHDATFPRPLDLPGRSVRWYHSDIVEWALSLRGELA